MRLRLYSAQLGLGFGLSLATSTFSPLPTVYHSPMFEKSLFQMVEQIINTSGIHEHTDTNRELYSKHYVGS